MDAEELLRRRLERERAARREAEAIAERVTADLYAHKEQLQRLNHELVRANDELQTLNQSMRDFVAIASHDLRGPLTSILGYAMMMQNRWSDLAEKQKLEFLAIIERQGTHLTRLVEDLLTVSRIEAGALDVHAEVVALREALDAALTTFAEHAAAVRVLAPPGLMVTVDPHHFERIIDNFIANALKYGAPPVLVEASENGLWVEIRVRDAGEGVPSEFVPRLFGRFARADTEGTRANSGTGLGLSIVRGLAQANGGDTWYEPNTPNGSCFGVRFPRSA